MSRTTHKQFVKMVERLKKDTEHFKNLEVGVTEDGHDEVIFDVKYVSLDELGEVNKRLRIHLMHIDKDAPPQLRALLDGKIIICEQKKCPTCGNEEWKNVTREVGAKLLGGSVQGW